MDDEHQEARDEEAAASEARDEEAAASKARDAEAAAAKARDEAEFRARLERENAAKERQLLEATKAREQAELRTAELERQALEVQEAAEQLRLRIAADKAAEALRQSEKEAAEIAAEDARRQQEAVMAKQLKIKLKAGKAAEYDLAVSDNHPTLRAPINEWFSGPIQTIPLDLTGIDISVGDMKSECRFLASRWRQTKSQRLWDVISFAVMYRQYNDTSDGVDKTSKMQWLAEIARDKDVNIGSPSTLRAYMTGFHGMLTALGCGFALVLANEEYFDKIRIALRRNQVPLGKQAQTNFARTAIKFRKMVVERKVGWAAPYQMFDDVIDKIIEARARASEEAYLEAVEEYEDLCRYECA